MVIRRFQSVVSRISGSLVGSAVALACSPHAAVAQQAVASPGIEVVVVTAQRREE
jgi:hypothetical protein